MMRDLIIALSILAGLLGCNQQARLDKLIPKDEVEFSKRYLALFQSGDFHATEEKINPDLKDAQLAPKLREIAALFPEVPPDDVQLVGSHTLTSPEMWKADLTFQYEFPSKWLLAHIALQKTGDVLIVNAVNVQPLEDSLENINRFTFQGKPPGNYIVLALAVLVPLFIIFVLVLCIKTPIPRKKWVWVIFVLLGFGRLTVNWTTGAMGIHPFSLLLLGAGSWKASHYAPVLIHVALPLGAIIFMLKRKQWLAQPAESEDQPVAPAT